MAKISDMGGWFGGPQADVSSDYDSVSASPYAPEPTFERVPVNGYDPNSGWDFGAYNPYVYGNPQSQSTTPNAVPAPAPVFQPSPSGGSGYPGGSSGGGGSNGGGYTGGGGGGGGGPVAQAKPVLSDADWLSGDPTFQAQKLQYNQQLDNFLHRLSTQKEDFTKDYDNAVEGFNANKDRGLLALGEDYTGRGMARSGLFLHAQDLANKDYDRTFQGMTTAKDRTLADFSQQEKDRQQEINQAIDNAQMQALGRRASQQMF